MKILIVEDNADLCASIRTYLEREGYRCEVAMDYGEASERIALYNYDVIVLDLNLPGGSGLQILRELKSLPSGAGVIIVSARDSLDDKLTGLDIGADDYITKPFHLSELNARIRAVFRRRHLAGQSQLVFGDLVLDLNARAVFADEHDLELTRTEFDLLLYLVQNPNRVLTKQSIAEHIWGDHMDLADNFDFIYTHVKNLRKKLASHGAGSSIRSIYGIGYRFDPVPAA